MMANNGATSSSALSASIRVYISIQTHTYEQILVDTRMYAHEITH